MQRCFSASVFMVWNKNKLDHYDNLQNAEHFDACCLSILVLAFLQGEGSSTETLLLRCLATGTWSPYVSLLGTEMLSSEHPSIVTWEVLQMPPNLCSLFAVHRFHFCRVFAVYHPTFAYFIFFCLLTLGSLNDSECFPDDPLRNCTMAASGILQKLNSNNVEKCMQKKMEEQMIMLMLLNCSFFQYNLIGVIVRFS